MQQLIYVSQPFGYSASILANILMVARSRNQQYDISGALICRRDIYVQLLEGPTGRVENLFERIKKDDRHLDIRLLVRGKIEDRLFPGWSMRHDPAVSWLWTEDELRQGAMETATARDIRAIFVRLANTPPPS